jgi:hypothetical protein
MTEIQPYQFEQEEALQDEDDSDCFKEKKRNHRRNHEENREH